MAAAVSHNMFKKLLSNLAFNPSLINQIGFYTARVRSEAVVRRSGLVVMSLALALQVFAVVSPPQPTLARSNNDMIVGGITSKDEAVNYCNQNTRSYQTLLAYYGITCADLANTTTVSIKSTDYNKRLYSMGHLAYGKAGETPINVPGTETVYMRYLHSWDSGYYSTYKALKGTTKSGLTFFILYNCGNLVLIGLPTPPKVCEYNKSILADDQKCFEPCPIQGKEALPKSSKDCVAPCPYNKKLSSKDAKCFEPCPVKGKEALPKASTECFVPCKYNSTISENDAACKPCEQSQSKSDLRSCIEFKKTVSNTTAGDTGNDANGTTAKAGDTLQYTLTTSNKGKVNIPNFAVSENISDVLDYADVVSLNGGSLNQEGVVVWPAKDIAAGKALSNTITVKVKNPIPSTPASSSDPGHFDLTMTNAYGNTVSVKLPGNITKTTEVLSTQLPNTGPGTTLTIAFILTAVGGYLFARTRLMVHELEIVRNDFASSGGNG